MLDSIQRELTSFAARNVNIQMKDGKVRVLGASNAVADALLFAQTHVSSLRGHFFRKNFLLLLLNIPAARTLYCVPGYLGNSLVYRGLAVKLAGDVTVRSFHFNFVRALSEDTLPMGVAQIARAYCRQLLSSGDIGPYNLYGFSFGGVIAVELARQLKMSGREVSALILGDTGPPWDFGEEPPWKQFVRLVADDSVASHVEVLHAAQCVKNTTPEAGLRKLVELQDTLSSSKAYRRSYDELRRVHERYTLYCRRLMSFRLSSYPGSLLFLQSRGEALDLLYKVRSVAKLGAITRTMTFSNHDQFVRPPGVEILAEVIREALTS